MVDREWHKYMHIGRVEVKVAPTVLITPSAVAAAARAKRKRAGGVQT